MAQTLQERVTSALAGVRNNRLNADVLTAEMVRDVATTTDGKVRLTLLMSAEDDAVLVRQVRHALEAIAGVTDVRVDVKDAAELTRPSATASAPPPRRP